MVTASKRDSSRADSSRKTARGLEPSGASVAQPTAAQPAQVNPLWAALSLAGARGAPVVQRKCAACSAGSRPCPSCEEEEEAKVQRKEQAQRTQSAGSSGDTGDAPSPILAAARPGLAHASSPLPHNLQIQRAFGRHDVSRVRVGIGGPAARANDRMGAVAFTSGERIAFREAPDLRLAAHESAHVVQQREGLSLPGGVGASDDQWERQADRVADAVVSGRSAEPLLDRTAGAGAGAQLTPAVQLEDKKPDYSNETKDQFATRVREKAAARLVQNIAVLGEWSKYVKGMEGFQLRAQLLTGIVTEHATTAAPFPRLRQRFEDEVGTRNEYERAYEGSILDVDATYRERSNNLMDYLTSMSVTGYNTTPSIAENLQVLAGDRTAASLPPSRYVAPDPRYSEYTSVMKRHNAGEIGGCETCHEINLAWQRTADRWGSPLPRGPLFKSGLFALGVPGYDQNAAIAMFQFGQPKPYRPSTSATEPPPAAGASQAPASPPPAVATPNPFVPSGALPAGVELPAARTDLCGQLPDAEDSKRIPKLSAWGPNSAVVANVLERIDAVLTPLGPRGYRVLGRQIFDQLYAVSPDKMEGVRDGIIARIDDKKKQYDSLRSDILAGKMPYEELCPIVDELLPSTNALVKQQALDDVHAWQRKERVLQVLELTLLALSILYPPSLAITIPAGMLLGLARISLGMEQQRQGAQWTKAQGAGLVSLKQEAEAPTLADRGKSNIITGALSFAVSAASFAKMVTEARASAQLLEALQKGAIIRHAEYPGIVLLSKEGKLLLMTEQGDILGYGLIQDGQILWAKMDVPFNPFASAPGAAGSTGGSSLVPYGPTAMVPYGSTSLVPYGSSPLSVFGSSGGSSALTPYGSSGLAFPTFATPYSSFAPYSAGNPLLLSGPRTPLMLTGPGSPPLLTAGTPAPSVPAVDPGGRGLYAMAEMQVSTLPAADAARLRTLQGQMPASEAELVELVALRTRAAGGTPLAPIAGTPEHMLARWKQYSGPPRNGSMSFAQWSAGHPSRMANSVAGPAAEERYRTALSEGGVVSRSAVIKTPSGQTRQIDVLIEGAKGQGRSLIQIKAGEEALTTTPRASGGASLGSSSLSNTDALAADAEFIANGDRVTWVFEKNPTGPLVAKARQQGVDVIVRVDDAAGKTRMIGLMRRAGMGDAEINSVTFVEGTIDDVVAFVAKRFGAK